MATTFLSAFQICDDVLRQALLTEFSDLITYAGHHQCGLRRCSKRLCRTPAPFRWELDYGLRICKDGRSYQNGLSISPCWTFPLKEPKASSFAISGWTGLDHGGSSKRYFTIITESIDPDAKIIFGTINDERLKKGEIKVTVIATGFPAERLSGNSSGLIRKPRCLQAPTKIKT